VFSFRHKRKYAIVSRSFKEGGDQRPATVLWRGAIGGGNYVSPSYGASHRISIASDNMGANRFDSDQ